MKKKNLYVLLTTSLLALSCGIDLKKESKDDETHNEDDDSSSKEKCMFGECPNQLTLTSTLTSFNSCEIATQHIRSKMIAVLERDKEQ